MNMNMKVTVLAESGRNVLEGKPTSDRPQHGRTRIITTAIWRHRHPHPEGRVCGRAVSPSA
jgi:hypothetical protein